MTSDSDTVSLRITLRYRDLDEFVQRYADNLSAAGLFLRTKAPKPTGTKVRFELLLTSGTRALRGEGVVVSVRTDSKPGMALRFNVLDAESQALVDRVVKTHGNGALAPTPLSGSISGAARVERAKSTARWRSTRGTPPGWTSVRGGASSRSKPSEPASGPATSEIRLPHPPSGGRPSPVGRRPTFDRPWERRTPASSSRSATAPTSSRAADRPTAADVELALPQDESELSELLDNLLANATDDIPDPASRTDDVELQSTVDLDRSAEDAASAGADDASALADAPRPNDEPATLAHAAESANVAPVDAARPVGESASVAPVGESASVAPVGESASVAPVGESASVAPVDEPAALAPVDEPATLAPGGEPAALAPSGEPATVAPGSEPATRDEPVSRAPSIPEAESGLEPDATAAAASAIIHHDDDALKSIQKDVPSEVAADPFEPADRFDDGRPDTDPVFVVPVPSEHATAVSPSSDPVPPESGSWAPPVDEPSPRVKKLPGMRAFLTRIPLFDSEPTAEMPPRNVTASIIAAPVVRGDDSPTPDTTIAAGDAPPLTVAPTSIAGGGDGLDTPSGPELVASDDLTPLDESDDIASAAALVDDHPSAPFVTDPAEVSEVLRTLDVFSADEPPTLRPDGDAPTPSMGTATPPAEATDDQNIVTDEQTVASDDIVGTTDDQQVATSWASNDATEVDESDTALAAPAEPAASTPGADAEPLASFDLSEGPGAPFEAPLADPPPLPFDSIDPQDTIDESSARRRSRPPKPRWRRSRRERHSVCRAPTNPSPGYLSPIRPFPRNTTKRQRGIFSTSYQRRSPPKLPMPPMTPRRPRRPSWLLLRSKRMSMSARTNRRPKRVPPPRSSSPSRRSRSS